MSEAISTNACKIGKKIWKRKDHNNMETELRMLERVRQGNLHADKVQATHKKLANWKTPGVDGIHGFWLKKLTSIHNRLATEINKCIQKTDIPKGRPL